MSDEFEIIEGATVIDASTFYTSWERPNDVLTNRLVMDVNGHNVQVVRYDFDPNNVSIMIDGNISVVQASDMDAHIKRNT